MNSKSVKETIINDIIILIRAIGIPLFLAFHFGSYTLQLLFLVSYFGYVAFVVLDRINWFNEKILTKFSLAILTNITYRFMELNDYEPDTRSFEYIDNGFLVKHLPEEKVFRFLSFNDYIIIFVFTIYFIILYVVIKHMIKLSLNKFKTEPYI